MKYQNSDTKERRGSFGGMTATTVKADGKTENILKTKVPKRGKDAKMTYGQREEQARMATAMAAYDPMKELFTYSFLKEGPFETRNGLFFKHNVGNIRALITKDESERSTQLLDNYVISYAGEKLPTIMVDTIGLNHVFGINVGDLVIDENTTVYQFSEAIVSNSNAEFSYGDALTIAVCTQLLPVGNVTAKIAMRCGKVELYGYNDERGRQKLSTVAPLSFFHVTAVTYDDGTSARFLSYPAKDYVLVAPIHSRELEKGKVVCSDQQLCGTNPYLDEFLSSKSQHDAIYSYGPVAAPNRYKPSYVLPEAGRRSRTLAEYMAEKQGQQVTPPASGNGTSGSGSTGNGTGNTDPTNPGQGGSGTGEKVQIVVKTNPTECASLVSGGGEYEVGTRVTLRAEGDSDNTFVRWNTGTPPPTLEITVPAGGATYTAYYE